ncbi:hypothetical protein AC249_AIPGENE6662 [Exaiptasia diaphana]|nr:hypothetical protein AC249_AIPGENE6662 [Exaiptasia diaphana]
MTFMYKDAGSNYHWMRELFDSMRLPIPDGIEEIWMAENNRRMKALQKKKTTEAKSARAKQKQRRLQESEQRKKFMRRQKILHTYGEPEDNDLDEGEVREEVQRRLDGKTRQKQRQRKKVTAP